MRQPYDSVVPYITKDGSEIRELMHPAVHGNQNQSLAEAMVPPGARTLLGEGVFMMTVDQGSDMDRYQGMTSIDGETLAGRLPGSLPDPCPS